MHSGDQTESVFMKVYVCFRRSDGRGWKGAYGKAVSCFIGEFTHCELMFVRGKTRRSLLVKMGENARWVERAALDDARWKIYRVNIAESAAATLWAVCDSDAKRPLEYDYMVHCNLLVPRWLQCRGDPVEKASCSTNTIRNLKQVGFCKTLDVYSDSPNSLEKYCKAKINEFSVVSTRIGPELAT